MRDVESYFTIFAGQLKLSHWFLKYKSYKSVYKWGIFFLCKHFALHFHLLKNKFDTFSICWAFIWLGHCHCQLLLTNCWGRHVCGTLSKSLLSHCTALHCGALHQKSLCWVAFRWGPHLGFQSSQQARQWSRLHCTHTSPGIIGP